MQRRIMSRRMKRERVQINVRLDKKTRNRIRWLAKTYAEGNVSKWMLYAALEAPRKRLK